MQFLLVSTANHLHLVVLNVVQPHKDVGLVGQPVVSLDHIDQPLERYDRPRMIKLGWNLVWHEVACLPDRVISFERHIGWPEDLNCEALNLLRVLASMTGDEFSFLPPYLWYVEDIGHEAKHCDVFRKEADLLVAFWLFVLPFLRVTPLNVGTWLRWFLLRNLLHWLLRFPAGLHWLH